MGETRAGRPPERVVYPGLVRPYTNTEEDNDYVNQPKLCSVNKMYKTRGGSAMRPCSNHSTEHDPFSIYDDDSAHDHYFFLPAGKVDLDNFKRSNSQRDSCGTWSRTKPPPERTKPPDKRPTKPPDKHGTILGGERVPLRNTNSNDTIMSQCQCRTIQNDDARHTRHCRRSRVECRHSLIARDSRGRASSASGDYCSLSADAVAPHYPAIHSISTRDTPIDEEHFRKFALNLVRTSPPDINKNSNDYHDPTRTKHIMTSKCDLDDSSDKVEMYDVDKCIDQCTCMICVKAGRYHWSGDRDSFIEEPCNCTGGRKNIVRRWLCMGVLALFLPCLICYLPAKLCQNSCTSKHCTKTKLKDKQLIVKYCDERTDGKLEEDTGRL